MGTRVGTNTSTVGRRTDEIIGRSLLEKRSFLRNALTSGTAQFHEESTKVLKRKQITGSSKSVQGVSVSPSSFAQSMVTYNFPRQLCTSFPSDLLVFSARASC